MGKNEFLKNNIFSIILLLILIINLIFNQISNNNLLNDNQQIKTHVDTVYITKTITKHIKGKDIYHEDIKITNADTVFLEKIDTIKVIEDYSTHRLYIDTLNLDNGNIIIKDTLYKNRIESRYWVSNIREKIITKEKFKELPLKNSFYIGFNLFQEKPLMFNSFSSSFLLKTKKDKIFILSLGIDKNIKPILGTSYFLKIK